MKLHLPYLLRRAVVRALFAAATVITTLASATHADMITPDGRTATSVIQSGNVYNVYTNTVRGSTGFNSFSTFDVYADTTANLHLADGTGRLINVVRDSASHIDGVLNSYKNGRIGGDVYFLNPNGIFVGKTGVVNVGSISMSTPTAAFVEQLIARDGSISPTATQAVLAGDMPINEKGTISIKGKVNARNTVEMRAGKVEVKGGEINTGVKFREMVNTGKRKVDTKGMSIQDGRLSFGKKPAKARRAVAKAKKQQTEKKTEIAIFANDVLVDGGDLNADWVYIDPDELNLSNMAISGDYTLEARVIILNNFSVKSGEKLTSFTLKAANEQTEGTFAGNVSITLSNSNIVADAMNISATATTNAAEAAITISNSTLKAELNGSAVSICATSDSGNARVDIQNSSLISAGRLDVTAAGVKGNASLTLGAASSAIADSVTLAATAVTGDATVNVPGKVSAGNAASISANTGIVYSDSPEDAPIQEMEFKSAGGGNATVTVDGTVEAMGELSVTASALGTYGDAKVTVNGQLSSQYTETKPVGELALERTPEETVLETDTEDLVNAKNQAYLERYAKYLKDKETDTAAVGTIELAATSSAGNASITQAAVSAMQSNLSATINAKAAKAASVLLAGKVTSGDIVATAQGETASLRVAEGATLTASPHQVFVQDGTEIFVEKSDGTIALEAVAPKKEDQPAPADQAPQKQEGVLLEVAGSLIARRETKDGAGEGGTISLVSEGKMLVGGKAVLDASSANGEGGLIYLEAPEYELLAPLGNYKVDGTSGKGSVYLANYLELTGDNINDADDISRDFIRDTLHLTETSNDIPSEWKGTYVFASLSGNIKLNKDLNVSVATIAIKDGTQISGDNKQYSLTLTNSFLHIVSPTSIVRIGNNVHITDVKNFTFKFGKTSIVNALLDFYVFTPTSLTVGSGFKVDAAENVTISMEGMGNTYITFGQGVDIKAGKDVLISAKNKNGWGGTLGNNTPMDVLSLMKYIPGMEGTPASELLSNLGFIKFDIGKFVAKGIKHIMKKEYDDRALPHIGMRISKASVTFADKNAGKIEGGSVTISSSSTADVSGRQNATKGGVLPFAGSVGYIYNNSKVDLGKDLVINATGFKTVKDAAGVEHKESVSITSTTTSKVSLQNVFDCNRRNLAFGLLISVGTDFNTVNIDGSVSITGEHDINIGAKSNIKAEPFMTLGSGWNRKIDPPVLNDANADGDEPGAYANNIIMIGVNLLKHKSETTINGSLVSNQGNISMKSEDEINSSLTMNGSIRYSLEEKGKDPEKCETFLLELARECFSVDLGVFRYKIGEELKWFVDMPGLLSYLGKPEKFLTDLQGDTDVHDFFDLAIATDIVLTDNKLYFNGKANAANGTVTINAVSEIEAACGAETSIAGVRAKNAVAAAISVPVICGNTTVEIGGKANINASKGISISSSTELPMSFDIVNWRNWSEFAKNKGVVGNIAQAVKALRGSLKFLYDYGDNGDFGILDSVTSSHASTLMRKTGSGVGDDKTIGGDLVVDVRNLNTRTIINDNAKLKAGSGAIKVNSSSKGTQVTVAGQLPIFLTLSNPLYISKYKAESGFGASIIVGEKTFNTATYIGAATLEAKQLNVDATGDVFMMEMSIGGTFGSEDKGVQGGLNIIAENKMTVSEISGNAKITLSGNGDAESSSITATDKSTLLNISGLQADGGHTAVGFGVTITLNNAFTAAMLGNNTAISSAFQKNWESLKSTYNMPFAREGAITLNLQGSGKLDVLAENRGTLLNIGIAGAVQTSSEEGGTADAAANVGVTHTRSETTARQTGVTKIGSYNNTVTTKAKEHTNIISVAGDASINVAGKNVVTGAGALSVNRGVMDTTAYVTDCAYDKIGDFTVATDNTSKVVAVDVAAAVGAAKAGIAAGSAWNSLTGNTGSYLTGGRISATNLNVTSLTDLTSFSCTLGAAIGITINAGGQGAGELDRAPGDALDKARDLNDADKNDIFWRNDLLIGDKDIGDDGEGLTIGEDLPELLDDNGVSFDLGASIARNALTMSSTAKVEGCVVSTPGLLKVTAEDNSVITAIGIGAAFDHADGTTIGSGGVFSFAPVGSTAEAAIIGKGDKDVLDINAGSLTLQAKDNHRERVWSFGGGYGDTAGIGLVLSWGSFAGTKTLAVIDKVNGKIRDKVDILASSTLDSTFISVGASASKGYAAVTGMVNYLNFNNQVITDIKNSTLTVTNVNGEFDALSQSKRTFTDGVGDIGIRVGGKGGGAAVGAALSFVYLGGNGAGDTNLTEMMVNNSVINNSGTTKLSAKSTTTGILAGANTGIAAVSSGLFGLAVSGSFSWLSDASFTQVDIKDTFFNQRKSAVAADKNADITAEATSSSNLTFGFGTLNVQIGQLDKPGGAVGASVGVLKDNATTAATMVGGGVGNAHDFTLHASGRSDMDSLIVGASGSALAGVSGGALAATISHRVGAYMEESVMNMNGALTIKADNLSNVGKGGKTRFTIANGALGVSGAGAGVGVSFIDIVDKVSAKAHNASVKSGSMEVLAQEESNADAVTVNVAGAQYIGMNATVARPVLRGEATACITANKQKIANGTADVGIVTTRTTDQKGRVITTGDLKVNAKNTQWMRSHLWSFVLGVNPKLPSVDVCVTSNSINMVGSANAWIEGPLTLSVGGDLTVEALTDRTATYTTVPVVAAISLYGFALNVDVNSMRVSSDTGTYTVEESSVKKDAAKQIDREIEAIYQLLKKGGIKPDGKKDLVLSEDVKESMTRAAKSIDDIKDAPATSVKIDLSTTQTKADGTTETVAGSATVGGKAKIHAKDTITTTPTTVNVSGGMLAVAPHFTKTTLDSTVEAVIKNTQLTATGDIEIDAEQKHSDNFHNVGVAIAGASISIAKYDWLDSATTMTLLDTGTMLKSKSGSVNVNTHSDISELFHHVNVGVGIGNVALILPSYVLNETNWLSIGGGVGIEADKAVNIGTNSILHLDSATYDVLVGGVNASLMESDIALTTTQDLTTGDKVAIKGASVDIKQDANRTIGVIVDHISVSGVSCAVPFQSITDTVNATLSIGDGNQITATGALSIDSYVKAYANLSFFGANVAGIHVSSASNSFTENITNKTVLGDNVKLRGGAMTVRARNEHTGDMKGRNCVGSLVGLPDVLTTYNKGNVSSDVTIGTGFDAKGDSLTLEAYNKDTYLCNAQKISVSIVANVCGKNAFNAGGTSSATITLGGGEIDVLNFTSRALTDTTLELRQQLGGGSIVVDVNVGAVETGITQTATVTLGTGSNNLTITTDNVSITAHNKYRFDRLDKSSLTMVYGGNVGLVTGTSKGTIDAKETVTATVTLGSGTKIQRRADAEHYLNKESYAALISATNNVESNASINLFAGGALNANCLITTKDATKANATLNLNGSIDTWGDTELTAYSHTRHNMRNTVTSGAIIPTFNSWVTNTIDAIDTVNIKGTVESIGNVLIQSGSTAGRYSLMDGTTDQPQPSFTTVLAGADDTNTTNYAWGKNQAIIYNKRQENLNINADVRAGGELSIINDSSANTVLKSFSTVGPDGKNPGNRTAKDFTDAAHDIAAEVTSSITIGNDAKLYAGLGSAVDLSFKKVGGDVIPQFVSAQNIFKDSTDNGNGTWTAPESVARQLYNLIQVDGRNRLVVKPLTLPGMALRVVSAEANRSALNGKLFSPSKHGLDVFFAPSWQGDAETTGVTLRGYESGLIFNRKAEKDAVAASTTAMELYLAEGVSIRSQAVGDLYVSGVYEFPYSTFCLKSDKNLTITGYVHCGSLVVDVGGNFIHRPEDPNAVFSQRGAESLYKDLFNEWEAGIPALLEQHAEDVVQKSGNHGKNITSAKEGVYLPEAPYKRTFTEAEILKALSYKGDTDPKAKPLISATGTVDIKAKVVDLNGEIYSGFVDPEMVINENFMVLNPKGMSITKAEADAMYEADKSNSVFRLDGYRGISLVYDAENKCITLNSFATRKTGITIDGTIVNSNPDNSKTGLYVAGSLRDMKIDNRTGLDLNIGNIDLTETKTSGITLKNTATGETTAYTLNDKGEWICAVTKDGKTTTTGLGSGAVTTSYTDLANYQVLLERKIELTFTEQGRLTHQPTPLKPVPEPDSECKEPGKVSNKWTIVDEISINTKGAVVKEELNASYVPWSSEHGNGLAISSHEVSPVRILKNVFYRMAAWRWEYVLEYQDLSTDQLYIGAANPIAINLGAGSGTIAKQFSISSQKGVNFTGEVKAASCVVEAGGSITAGERGYIKCDTINIRSTQGSIGTEAQALAFNSGTASFTAAKGINLVARKDSDSLLLRAGESLRLQADGNLNGLEFHAGNSAVIDANGQINVVGGANSSSAESTTLSSATGGINVQPGAFAPGVLSATAKGDVSISTTGALALDYVESLDGSVNLHADQGITTVSGTDESTLYAVPGSSSLFLSKQAEASVADLADEYYAKLLQYELLYYEKDEQGNYTHRAADNMTFILPEELKSLVELRNMLQNLYDSGQGDYLGMVMFALSGTDAVGGQKFDNVQAALTYLAEHADKLQDVFAPAYYDLLVADLTKEIIELHGDWEGVDYGDFNETAYRLYWLKDENGKLVNQNDDGDFINPKRYDAFGNELGTMYDQDICDAITAQFADQDPESSYECQKSKLLGGVADAASGYSAAATVLMQLSKSPATVAGGKPAGEQQIAVRAAKSVTLTTSGDKNIGGGAFTFSFRPVAKKDDGTFVYSDWVNLFCEEIQKGRRVGVQRVHEDKETGELFYAMSYFDVNSIKNLNALEVNLLQQALPSDIRNLGGVYRVYTRNYVCVDANEIKAQGKNVLIKTNGDIVFSEDSLKAENLYLSTTGAISGTVESSGGIITLYAEQGIGTKETPFTVKGTSTYTLGSVGDVYLKTDGNITLASLNGNNVSINAREGSLTPVIPNALNIIGRRIDYYGDLNTGLGFRTFGTSQAEGGLHWHGGSSQDVKYRAYNTAYTFWFVQENGPDSIGSVDIGYSGHLVVEGLPEEIRSASFRQNDENTGLNTLEIKGEHTFSEGLAFGGEAPYTILAPELLTIGGGSPLAIGGDAAFRMAGIQTADGSAIRLRGTGNLAFSGYTADSACEFRNALVIDSPGDIEFAGPVTFADSLTITGAGDRTIRSAQMMTFISGADINVDGNVSLQLAGIESVDGSPVHLRSTGNMAVSGYTADSDCTITAALALDSPGSVTLNNVSSAGTLTMNAGYGIFGRNVTSPQIIANSANADVFLNADTYDLSGSSWNSFVVDLEPIQDGHSVIVHDISVNPFTGRVVVRSLSDQLLLDGTISGAALEFYSPGDIMKGEGVSLSSEYPFIDVWREFDPTVYLLDMEALRGDLTESFIWCVDDSYDNAPQNSEDARKLRRKAAGETEILTLPELRFLDKDGNTVSREQYANLITNK